MKLRKSKLRHKDLKRLGFAFIPREVAYLEYFDAFTDYIWRMMSKIMVDNITSSSVLWTKLRERRIVTDDNGTTIVAPIS